MQTILRGRKNRVLQAQIPLSSVVEKKYNNGFAGELYRTIDFGIFDDSGDVLVLIELNDASHFQQKRIYRDGRVKMILDDANIPLVTFWANKPNEIDYITKVLWNYL